jgi:hypothetical protein
MLSHEARIVVQAMLELAGAGKRPRPIFYLDLVGLLDELGLSPQGLNDAIDEVVASGVASVLRNTNSSQEFITYRLKKGVRGYLAPPGPRLRLSSLAA